MKRSIQVLLIAVIAVALLLPLLLIADGPAVVNVSYARPLPFDPGDTFLGLPDTPVTYTGYAGNFLVVNSGETALAYSGTIYEYNNRIGIGTATPASPLHVLVDLADTDYPIVSLENDNARGGTRIKVLADGPEDAMLQFVTDEDGTPRNWVMGVDGSDGDKFKIGDDWLLANVDDLVVTTGGDVGIGTAVPAYLLDVNGDVRAMGSMIAQNDLWAGDDLTVNDDAQVADDLLVNGLVEIDTSTTGPTDQVQPLLTLDAQPATGLMSPGYGPELRFEIYGAYRGGIGHVRHDDLFPQTRFEFRAGARYGNESLVGVIVGPVYETAEGNERGDGAVDFGVARSDSADVASGSYSVISGGTSNSASGLYAVVGGGGMNTASGDWATVAGGEYNEAEGHYSTVTGGRDNTAGGHFSQASGDSAIARNHGEQAHASGGFLVLGDAQHSTFVMRIHATHDTDDWFALYLDGISELMVLYTNDVWTFEAQVVASTYSAGTIAGYTIVGVIENDDGATVLRAANVTTIYEDNASWDVRAIGDSPNDALIIEVRDSEAGEQTVFWVATVEATIVNF